MAKACGYCGATTTQLGKPLTGEYCSPTCLHNGKARRFKTSHGGPVDSAGDSDDFGYGLGDFRNQFDALFDKRGRE